METGYFYRALQLCGTLFTYMPLHFSSLSLNMLTSGLDYEGWVSGMKGAARIECSCPRMNGATHSGEDNERKEKSGFQKQMACGASSTCFTLIFVLNLACSCICHLDVLGRLHV